ncbi:MAG: GTPase HflX [Candidatus Gracilibacteria bacterium]|nr:GTPase HflX [Candidatus Gracilibacteria bacterium]
MRERKSERELEQIQQNLEYKNEQLKVFIADIIPTCCARENMEDRMIEVENLVNTYGGLVILKHIQKRGLPDYNTYIGTGKLDEIIDEMRISGANLLIFGNILKPHQIHKINEKLREIGAKAWDRVDLILKIFEKNAKTTESKLQIELASIKHMGPRIFGMGMELSRQGGGSKLARGKGETNTEIMKRHLRSMEDNIKKELEKYSKVREEHRKGRQKKGFFTVGIVGYTNAGKSSLLNTLTGKGVLSEDKLFATLGTSVGKMWIPNLLNSEKGIVNNLMSSGTKVKDHLNIALLNNLSSRDSSFHSEGQNKIVIPAEAGIYENYNNPFNDSEINSEGQFNEQYKKGIEILLNDTIGFIRDLPPELIKAFASTLEDSIESNLLLHVVDSSDKKIDEKIKVVDDILDSIKATQPRIYVFNKIDLITEKELKDLKKRFKTYKPVFISSYEKIGLDDLKNEIVKRIGK